MYVALLCTILINKFSASQYRSRFKIWKLKKPRKPRTARKPKETSEPDSGEVTAQFPAVRLAWTAMISLGLSAEAGYSESGYMRDEPWIEMDESLFC